MSYLSFFIPTQLWFCFRSTSVWQIKVCCTNTQEPSEGFPVNYILRFVNDVLSAARVKNQIKSELKAANTLLLLVRRINPPLLAVISHRESFSLGQWIDLQDLSAAHFIFYRKRVQSRAGAQHTAKDPDWLSLASPKSDHQAPREIPMKINNPSQDWQVKIKFQDPDKEIINQNYPCPSQISQVD